MPESNKVSHLLSEVTKYLSPRTVVVEAAFLAGKKISGLHPEDQEEAKQLAIRCIEEGFREAMLRGVEESSA